MTDSTEAAALAITEAVEKAEGKLPPKKRLLVISAVQCFAEYGYAATSTRQIADRAGVAEATIFRHFGTKKGLLLRLVTPVLDQLVVPALNTQQQITLRQIDNLPEMMRWMMMNRLEFARRYGPLVRIIIQELPVNRELRDVVMTHLAMPVGKIAGQELGRLLGRPGLPGDEAQRIMRLVASALLGYFITRDVLFPGHPWDDEAEVDEIVDMLCHGIMARTAAAVGG